MESRQMIFMYLFARNGDTDVENGLVDTVGERESGTNADYGINICTILSVE